VTLGFYGGAGTVTGSKYLLTAGSTRILVDAGLFQGRKSLRLLNWEGPSFDVRALDHVLVTHTHIDHIGYLPRLAKLGLRAPVHLTPATNALAELMLLDAAKIQEEDARYANEAGFSKHSPALPLYTTLDAQRALGLRSPQAFGRWFDLAPRGAIRARFLNAGHLLGAAFIELRVAQAVIDDREIAIVFSGDLGRFAVPLHLDPKPPPACDVLVIESTYGDRSHRKTSLLEQIGEPLRETVAAGGTALIPAFAVGRAQQITLMLRRLMRTGQLPHVPIHIDSPMAVDATAIYGRFLDGDNLDPEVFEDGRLELFPGEVLLHRTVDESKQLNRMAGPRIIISSSGMLAGGRVLHHLERLAGDPRNLLLLVGYQAEGTRGRALLDGAESIRMHGRYVPVRARVVIIEGLSGHADRDELLRWVESAPAPPRLVFVVHGEGAAATALAELFRQRFQASVHVPALGDEFDLLAMLGTSTGAAGNRGAHR
jgi:metallo-beta-lactamase family protein